MNKKITALALFISLALTGCSKKIDGKNQFSIQPAHAQTLVPGESQAKIIEKAAKVLPSGRQVQYLETEYNAFIVMGPNTYTGKEWGDGKEDPAIFNPTELDAKQWCQVIKEAGMKMAVLVVKHHDGFVLWQSRYTNHGVMSSPFDNGQGDIMRALVDACRPLGIKIGVYLSPADLYQIEAPDGLYGNGSQYTDRVIPRPIEGRPFADKRTFKVKADDYNEYFMNQLFELLTEYGDIHEVWFDGAHPKRKGGQTYMKDTWFDIIRELAPNAVIFGGPDVRWVGNESGDTRFTEWSVIPTTERLDYDHTAEDLGSRERLFNPTLDVYGTQHKATQLKYLVAETDTSIRHGWFYRDDTEQQVRSADDVYDMYERIVGGNTVLLLNIPPNKQGRFSPRDVDAVLGAGKRIRATYNNNLLKHAKGPVQVLDDEASSFWQTTDKQRSFEIALNEPVRLNRFMLQEAIATQGQRIEKHALDAWLDGQWQTVSEATTVGYKRILRFPAIETHKLRLRIPQSRLQASISKVAAYYSQPSAPKVSIKRDPQHQVVIQIKPEGFNWNPSQTKQGLSARAQTTRIVYTTDGSEPTTHSNQYQGAFAFESGVIKARTYVGNVAGAVVEARLGLNAQDWRVLSVSSESQIHPAVKAFDGDISTFWQTADNPSYPHYLALDLGASYRLSAFTYLPRQDEQLKGGMIEAGRVEVSSNGINWREVDTFEFGNIINDPSLRTHYFTHPIQTRFIRFVMTKGAAEQGAAGAAEVALIGQKVN